MISEVYNYPYISFFHCTCIYGRRSLWGVGGGGGGGGGVVYFTVMFDHPSCFLTFCRSGIPTSCYIFNVFITCIDIKYDIDIGYIDGRYIAKSIYCPSSNKQCKQCGLNTFIACTKAMLVGYENTRRWMLIV